MQLLDKMQGSALKKTRTSGAFLTNVARGSCSRNECLLFLIFILCSEVHSGAAIKTAREANGKLADAIAGFGADKRGMAEGLYRLQITALPQVFINDECADPKNEGCESNLVSFSSVFQSRASFVSIRALTFCYNR